MGADGLPRYQATDEEDRDDERLARVEMVALSLGGPVVARIMSEVLERFDATEADLIDIFSEGALVSPSTAASLARAFCHYRQGDAEAAAHVATPRIETMARAALANEPLFRVQRQRARGQFPQLGALLAKLGDRLDPSWVRFLQTFLVSPHGPNFRNELLHGFVDKVHSVQASLVLLCAWYLGSLSALPVLAAGNGS